jgi:hypothetical protein
MPSERSSAASPTPDSISSLALPTPPADRINSREAPMLWGWPSMSSSIPEQRVPVKVSLVTGVFVSSVRFGRDRLGRRKARVALTRVPSAAIFMLM